MKRMIAIALLAFPSWVGAASIVDTGAPVAWPDANGDPTLDANQWIAGAFEIASAYRITSVQGFLSSHADAGDLTVVLRGDAGATPGSVLFAAPYVVPAVQHLESGVPVPGWFGPAALDWVVGPGTYWVGFEVHAGQSFVGFMANPAAHPLAKQALTLNGAYVPATAFAGDNVADIGVRVQGDPLAVPEPAHWALLALGLAAVTSRYRIPHRARQ